MHDSWVWELANHIQNRIPDPVDYIEMRRKTFGAELGLGLSEPQGGELPTEVLRSRTVRALVNSAADATGLMNDIVSYRKEIELEGELNNGVLVVQNFLDSDLQRAVEVVNDLRTGRFRQFEHVVATELPQLADEFDLDTSSQEQLLGYVRNIENWASGVIQWHLESLRYKNPSPANPVARWLLAGPVGVGTAITRIGPFLELSKAGSRGPNK
jgi:germacradienol/geosmin synthase